VVYVKEYIFAPEGRSNLVARHQLSGPLDQKDQQFHRELFQTQEARAPLEAIARAIEYEIAEMKFLGRKWLGYLSTLVQEIMPHNPTTSNRISNLGGD
jgi:hypothetical protein